MQSAPKRIYPTGEAVGGFVGYVGEINGHDELASMGGSGYKAGQLIGKQGLRGSSTRQSCARREGVQFVEKSTPAIASCRTHARATR